ncbi:glpF6 [Symbiodinium microadriaticum]|nr:glpF6 [Symbiodinium microadriaticum]
MASQKDASALSTYGSTTGPTQLNSFAESMAPYVAEFIGTYLLVFTIAVFSIAESADFAGTAIGTLLAVLVYSLGPVSGGHFNPAVSFACGLTRKTPWPQVIAYILLQISAGLVAGIACHEIFQQPLGVSPIPPFGFWDASFLEALYTGMLCFVVLSVSTSKNNNPDRDQNHYFGLAIGLVIVAGGHAASGISGGIFNPAVSLGLEIVGARAPAAAAGPWGLAFAGMQIFGATMAAAMFVAVRAAELRNGEEPLREQLGDAGGSLLSKLLSEFLGTFLLCITVGLNMVMHSISTPWAAFAALASMIYAVHDISGGHLNPAVTAAVVFSGRGKCPAGRGVAYVAVQLLAGSLAGAITAAYQSQSMFMVKEISLQPKLPYSWIAVLVVETAFTSLLAFVVLSVATAKTPDAVSSQNFPFGFAIGACVLVGGFASSSISGGILNPAVAWSIATTESATFNNLQLLTYCLTYCLFQFAGGLLAAVVFRVTHDFEYRKAPPLLD